jgi:hypothetical protein
MKAEILADGTLVITPETPTETYALKCHREKEDVVQYNFDAKSPPSGPKYN